MASANLIISYQCGNQDGQSNSYFLYSEQNAAILKDDYVGLNETTCSQGYQESEQSWLLPDRRHQVRMKVCAISRIFSFMQGRCQR